MAPTDGVDDADEADDLPDWWRRNAAEFREHGLPDYRPPRFADGALVPPVVEDLESTVGASVRLRVVDPQAGNRWEVLVEGQVAGRLEHERHPDGYSVFGVTADAFAAMVREGAGVDG